jgi:hypothetical protein
LVQGAAAPMRLPVYVGCLLAALTCACLLGRDLDWDTLNQHLYAGFSAFHDRFGQDYFAAGPGSYFNPYAYAPFYALVSAGTPALVVALLLATAQSAILWMTYELALCALPSNDRRTCLVASLCALALGFLNPVLIEQFGSSFSDISTAVLALAGWVLLARAVRSPRMDLVVYAGLLLGGASALKLTNAVHAVAALALVVLIPRLLRVRARYLVAYAGALALGFVIVAAPWAYRLEQNFGNPFFPLLNGVFRSPQFTTEPLRSLRFIPGSVWEGLWRPFAIMDPVPMVQVESTAPDLRYAVLLVLVAALPARWLWRRIRGTAAASPLPSPDTGARVLPALGCGLILDWILWLTNSGNARYFLPMAAVAAVVLVALLFQLLGPWPKVRNYVLAAILGVQLLETCMAADYRSDPRPWNGPWLTFSVPPALIVEPNLFLSVGARSSSFLVPYLGAGAGMIDFSGAYALGPEGANGARVGALLRRYAPRVRVLVAGARLYTVDEGRLPTRKGLDEVLARFSLRIDPSDCQTIWAHGLPPPVELTVARKDAPAPEQGPADASPFLTCRVVSDPQAYPSLMAEQAPIDTALDHAEDACPQLLQARRPLTEFVGSVWRRVYFNTDLEVTVFHGELTLTDLLRGDDPIDLGRASEWEKSPPKLVCGRRYGHYFARVLSK